MSAKRVLIIATVDSGGGAGITADCLTVHDMGAFPLPCTVAVTAQSLKRVAAVESLSSDMTKTALNLALHDWPEKPSAVKVGFIPSDKVLKEVLTFLETELQGVPVIWDPVLTATAGRMDSADLKAVLPRLLKVTEIFTPNLPEALELMDFSREDLEREGIETLGRRFIALGAKAVMIKGGHVEGRDECTDVLITAEKTLTFSYRKKAGEGAHGGGCALSSALAALRARGYALEDAAVLAKAYVTEGIFKPEGIDSHERPPLGHHGFPRTLDCMPAVGDFTFPRPRREAFPPCPLNMGLYPVVGDVDTLEWLLAMGVRTAQLRIKDKLDPQLSDKIKRAVFLGRSYHARVFIDDHYELAMRHHAYGVHLGMEDVREADLNAIAASGLRLGLSTHGMCELLQALSLRPSYVALGHIFETQTKKMKSPAQGVRRLKDEVELIAGRVPTVAIAGIKLDNLDGVLQSGVGSVAVVTAITKAPDPYAACQEWLRRVGNGGDEDVR